MHGKAFLDDSLAGEGQEWLVGPIEMVLDV
jgi:hypothetical protein